MSAVHRKLRLLGHDVTVFTSTVNQTHMMPPDCLECTSTCRFKKKFLSFHACNHPMRRGEKKKSPFVIVPHEFFILRTEQRQMAPTRTTSQQRWGRRKKGVGGRGGQCFPTERSKLPREKCSEGAYTPGNTRSDANKRPEKANFPLENFSCPHQARGQYA